MKKLMPFTIIIILVIYGLITLFLSSSLLLDLFDVRLQNTNYVDFVVWGNLLCGILYLVSSIGFLKSKNWAIKPLLSAVIILIAAFIGLQFHINAGGAYLEKTQGALIFRLIITILFIGLAKFYILNKKNNS